MNLSNRLGIVIQARTGSSRLPNKIFKKIANSNSLEIIIRRLKKKFKDKYPIIIATTTHKNDQVIVNTAKKHNINYLRGSEKNVLSRFSLVAKKFNLRWIVRVTSDCPLINTDLLNRMIKYTNRDYQIISNVIRRRYSKGLDLEIIKTQTLNSINKLKLSDFYKEHVTKYLYDNIHRYKFYSYESKKDSSHNRITLDTYNDLKNLRLIFEKNKNIYFNYL